MGNLTHFFHLFPSHHRQPIIQIYELNTFNMPMQEYLIGRIVAVPSFMRAILPALESAYFRRIQSSLKVLVLSGETFHLSLWKILVKILPQTAILNLYGSTEVGFC